MTSVPSASPIKTLHLSDLHFGTTFDIALWDYVGKVLAGADKPDIIAVTEKHELVTAIWSIAVQYLRGLSEAVRNAAETP
jgi:hypothetical protein